MKTVYLTSGPRGSGKSEYVKSLAEYIPNVIVVSRDEILISLFGKTSLNPYHEEHEHAFSHMFGILKEYLSEYHPAEIIILDCWNGYSSERKELIKKLKDRGANKVSCIFFNISEDLCVEWYKQKPDTRTDSLYYEHFASRDYEHYYHHAKNIDEDGFDEIITINSNQLKFNFAFS